MFKTLSGTVVVSAILLSLLASVEAQFASSAESEAPHAARERRAESESIRHQMRAQRAALRNSDAANRARRDLRYQHRSKVPPEGTIPREDPGELRRTTLRPFRQGLGQ